MLLRPDCAEPPVALSEKHKVSNSVCPVPTPGGNLFCAFVNVELTHEDGVVMSRSAAQKFPCTATLTIKTDLSRDRVPEVNTFAEPHSGRWW